MKKPLVSVLMTAYNREDYIAEAIESVLAQTMQGLELVIVDDGSTDHTVDIARRYTDDPRVRLHFNEKNLGDYPNRNRAAELAVGRYLKYLDADDLIYPHALAVMVEAMEKWPIAALGLSWNVTDPPQPYPFISSPAAVYRAHYLGRSFLGVGPSAAILRRDAFEAVGGFTGRQFIGDSELWLKLAARWPLLSLPPALIWWRRHEGQQMSIEQTRPEVLTIRYRLECEMLESTTLLAPAEIGLALARLHHRHGRKLLSFGIRNRRLLTACRLWKDAGLSWGDLFRALQR